MRQTVDHVVNAGGGQRGRRSLLLDAVSVRQDLHGSGIRLQIDGGALRKLQPKGNVTCLRS